MIKCYIIYNQYIILKGDYKMSEAIIGFELWRLVSTANKYMDKTLKPLAKKYGLTPTQLRILYYIKKPGLKTIGAIAKMAGIACTNTSSICKKLSHMGLLRRTRNESDERIVEVELTDEGHYAACEIEKSLSEDMISGEEIRKINIMLENSLKQK